MSVSDMTPLLTRVEEVLCDGAGIERTIGAAHRFQRGAYPDEVASSTGTAAMVRKGMFASVTSATPMRQPEMHDVLMYDLTVRVEFYYHIVDPEVHTTFRNTLGAIATDVHRARGALCYPGNLLQTAAAEPTGLSGAGLQFRSWSMREPNTTARLVRASMELVGRINMTA
tara:strand:+ start:300 stop:809 length:510 start_codon:yes stop_codon:yes gene_type:complete